jgi:8-oxo-dGTP pyrophosphatase MutT (NUDIX family)
MRGDGIRYQGAVVRKGHLLLIEYRPRQGDAFWMLPGGGREDETPEQCVARELFEETGLRVEVRRHLLDEPASGDTTYRIWRTFLCSAATGEARPGSEPGADHLGNISAVRWFDLSDESGWEPSLRHDPITYGQAVKIRALLAPTPGGRG